MIEKIIVSWLIALFGVYLVFVGWEAYHRPNVWMMGPILWAGIPALLGVVFVIWREK